MERIEFKASLTNEHVKKIVRTCYPQYKGRKIRVDNCYPDRLDSYWDGGSRSYFCFYDIVSGEVRPVHSNHPMFESQQPRIVPDNITQNVLIVEHVIFCGKDLGIYIHVKPDEEHHIKQLN